jgi:hypothetical protein
MLQAWLSFGYIVLLAILVLAFILWRRGGAVPAIAALLVGAMREARSASYNRFCRPAVSRPAFSE